MVKGVLRPENLSSQLFEHYVKSWSGSLANMVMRKGPFTHMPEIGNKLEFIDTGRAVTFWQRLI